MALLLPSSLVFFGPLHNQEGNAKVTYLKMWAGDKGLDVFEGFAFAKPEDALELHVVLEKFEDYCAPRRIHIMTALKFNERCQGESVSFESFVTDLKILVKDCGYQEEEHTVRDVIVFRCKCTKVCEKCLDLADALTLEIAVEIGGNHETNLNSLKKLVKDEDPSVDARDKKKRPKRSRRRHPSKGQEKNPQTKESRQKPSDPRVKCKKKTEVICGRCAYDKTHKTCPAMGQQCGHCKKVNHYSKFCTSKEIHNLQEAEDPDPEESEEESPFFVYSLESSILEEDEPLYEIVEIESAQVGVLLDSGAKANMMSAKTYNNLKHGPLPPLKKKQTVLI